jgi:hypothetical protein
MVKTPKMRHSKGRREPVTIELEPGEVSRVAEDQASADTPNDEAAAEQAANASQRHEPDEAAVEQQIRAEGSDFEPWEHHEGATAAPGDPQPEAAADHSSDYGFDRGQPSGPNPANEPADRDGVADRDASAAMGSPPPEPRRGVHGVVAGLVGAVIALAGAGALQFAGLLGAPGSGAGSLDGVNRDMAALKTEMTALARSQNGGEAAARVKGLSDALDQVKADVAALKSSVEQGGAGDNAGLAALGDKVARIENEVAALDKAGNAAPVDLGPLNEKLSALDALVKSAGDAATAQQDRLAALEQSVSQLSARVEAQAAQPKIALAIAASALKAALDRGAPFSAELETFAAIAPDAPQIAALRAYAEKGVPTRVEIAGEMDAAANAMVAAASPPGEDAGFFEKLLSSAESLVKVRPIGAVEGAGVPETVARMEVAVNQGDYAKALAEYDALPEPVKAAGADFAGKLKARIEVEKQADALIAGAMKA